MNSNLREANLFMDCGTRGGRLRAQLSRSSVTVTTAFLVILAGCQTKTTETVRPAITQAFSAGDLAQRTIERRSIEAVIWGVPAVNFDCMYQAMVHDAKAGEGSNKIVYWSRLFDWKNQTRELGSHKLRRKIRSPLPFLRTAETSLRQNLEVAGHREDELIGNQKGDAV
jgi:hypothetical protein